MRRRDWFVPYICATAVRTTRIRAEKIHACESCDRAAVAAASARPAPSVLVRRGVTIFVFLWLYLLRRRAVMRRLDFSSGPMKSGDAATFKEHAPSVREKGRRGLPRFYVSISFRTGNLSRFAKLNLECACRREVSRSGATTADDDVLTFLRELSRDVIKQV